MIFSQSRHQANAIISTGHKRWNSSVTYMSNEERSSERRVGNCMQRELLNQTSLTFFASVVSRTYLQCSPSVFYRRTLDNSRFSDVPLPHTHLVAEGRSSSSLLKTRP